MSETNLLVLGAKHRGSVSHSFDAEIDNLHEIASIALGFRELHGVHSLASVPMQEGMTFVHGSEL